MDRHVNHNTEGTIVRRKRNWQIDLFVNHPCRTNPRVSLEMSRRLTGQIVETIADTGSLPRDETVRTCTTMTMTTTANQRTTNVAAKAKTGTRIEAIGKGTTAITVKTNPRPSARNPDTRSRARIPDTVTDDDHGNDRYDNRDRKRRRRQLP